MDSFFTLDLDLVELDSLLEAKFIDVNKLCKTIKPRTINNISKYMNYGNKLFNILKSKQLNYENLMQYLLKSKYKRLVTKHFLNKSQSIYSLNETQLRIILYNFILYCISNHINVDKIGIKKMQV